MLHRHRGFTLLEMMIVVAIIGIIAAMSVSAFNALGRRGGAQNAGHEFYSALTRAKARAHERSSDVWVIVYPNIDAAGTPGGQGAWFLYEDNDGDFLTGGAIRWSTFSPPGTVEPTDGDRLLDRRDLNIYPGRNVEFGPVTGVTMTGPFTGTSVAGGCGFCSGTPLRGAIVFSADGTARFVDSTGATVSNRTGGVAMRARDDARLGYQFAIARATGFITSFK